MKNTCYIHPTMDGKWVCPECGNAFCSDCVINREAGGYYGQGLIRCCPGCVVPTNWVGVSGTIKPFWTRIDKFFSYPFHANPLILIIAIAFLDAVLLSAPLGWFFRVFLSALMLNYAYLALRRSAQGDLTPPKMYDEALTAGAGPVLSQLVLFVLLAVAGGMITGLAGVLGLVFYGVIVMFFLPSMLIILAMDGNPIRAMNPVVFMALPFRIGGGYFIMWVFLVCLLFAPASLLYTVEAVLPPFWYEFFGGLFSNYYMIVAYHLMGYVLLQYHDKIGYEVKYEDIKQSDEQTAAKPDNRAAEAAKRTTFLFAEGKYDEAIEYIEQHRAQGGELPQELSEKYYALLKMKNKKAPLLAHAPDLLDQLTESNAKVKTLDVYGECIKIDAAFLPEPKALLKIAGWLAETGNPKIAISAYNKFAKSYPDNRDVPLAYFRAAQIFHDRLMNQDKAKGLLKGILKKFPDHAIAPKVKNYLQYIGG
ncbi:hypothetical protein Dalk_3723 [Desulfatibacillum aliphaticivorans]|uniref:B box-type domain-containing protein n=1 Tax=Desulfatibacillum aliphaticivorans TaxID=218208 RepID=B8FLQ6_DESAL|nr:tetratricopeptide repeat protein [Desulfatibacillum aliphaticivorans]ACL05410.1 hypothetical protein Dalk_3723 [Desulfatibacillum aliphaticivorans]